MAKQTKPNDSPTIARGGAMDYIAEPLRALAVPIDTLRPDAANARTHDEKNIDAIVASLHRFGQRLPIVVQKQGMIVRAGNGRLQAAKSMGWQYIAAVVVDEASVDATAFAIADNRTAELAGWDDETLAALLQSLPDDARNATGFADDDLAELLGRLSPTCLPSSAEMQSDLDSPKMHTCPECGHAFAST